MHGLRLIVLGFFLILFSIVASWLMVLRIVPSTLWLNFLAYGASVVGLILGIIGAAYYVRLRR